MIHLALRIRTRYHRPIVYRQAAKEMPSYLAVASIDPSYQEVVAKAILWIGALEKLK